MYRKLRLVRTFLTLRHDVQARLDAREVVLEKTTSMVVGHGTENDDYYNPACVTRWNTTRFLR